MRFPKTRHSAIQLIQTLGRTEAWLHKWWHRYLEFGAEGRHIVTAVGPDGAPTLWFPRFLVDASGRDTLLLTRLGLKRVDKRNNTAAVFGHFRNVSRWSGSGGDDHHASVPARVVLDDPAA